jgi:hypothetical protein
VPANNDATVRSIGNEAKKRGVYDFCDWRHGYVGGEIVRLLSQNGTAARALVRNPKNAKNLPVITS